MQDLIKQLTLLSMSRDRYIRGHALGLLKNIEQVQQELGRFKDLPNIEA